MSYVADTRKPNCWRKTCSKSWFACMFWWNMVWGEGRTDANRARLTCLLPVLSKQGLNGGGCWCSGTKELTLPAPLHTPLPPLILPVFQSIRCHLNLLFVFPFVLGQGAELPDNGQAHRWLEKKGKDLLLWVGWPRGMCSLLQKLQSLSWFFNSHRCMYRQRKEEPQFIMDRWFLERWKTETKVPDPLWSQIDRHFMLT